MGGKHSATANVNEGWGCWGLFVQRVRPQQEYLHPVRTEDQGFPREAAQEPEQQPPQPACQWGLCPWRLTPTPACSPTRVSNGPGLVLLPVCWGVLNTEEAGFKETVTLRPSE